MPRNFFYEHELPGIEHALELCSLAKEGTQEFFVNLFFGNGYQP